jgi:uncharacterized protein (TIGR03067 family)
MTYSSHAIEGRWQLLRAEADGEQAPELVVTKTELEMTHGAYAVRFAGQIADQGTFELGQATAHDTLLLRGKSGHNAGRVIPAIYQLKGDRLRVCFGFAGVAPTEFTATAGQARYLATYRRQTP